MNKNVKFAITGTLAVLILGGIIWFGVSAKKSGTTCQYCGKEVSRENEFGHESRCKANKTNRQFDQSK
mgnify:CR=1 FL=1